MSAELERRVVELNYRYAACLDENRLKDWPGFFIEDCRYLIQPRDNLEQGLEGYWLYFEGRGMLRDRVVSLLDVNIYHIHYERRLVTNVMLAGRDGDAWLARANYMLLHTDNEGRSRIFSVGEYRDRIVEVDGEMRLRERHVVADTFTVASQISTPL